ncbi:MAG: type II toxin-antitoxin system PemK/MazF family toxin [archaeon]
MNQLSVALARFYYTNQIDYKIRPALIISNEKFNKTHNFVWACPITTKSSLPEFELEIPAPEFSGNLNAKSYIRTDTIASMETELFLKEIGKISAKLFEKVKIGLSKNL